VDAVAPHDDRVLTVVGVVPATPADALEAERLVEADGVVVAVAHLQCHPPGAQGVGALDERGEEGATVSLVLVAGAHADGGDVRLVQHLPETAVADDLTVLAEHDVAGLAVLRELAVVGVLGPGSQEDFSFDRLHEGDVILAHGLDGEPGNNLQCLRR